MAIRVGVVRVALCLDDSKDNADDALADDAGSESRIGRPKQLLPVVQRVACYVSEGDVVGNALYALRALPLAGGLATHAWCTGDLLEVCPLKNHAQTRLRRRPTGKRHRLLRDIRWWRVWQVRLEPGWSLCSRLSSTAGQGPAFQV